LRHTFNKMRITAGSELTPSFRLPQTFAMPQTRDDPG
jgi:hypothetical protein